MFLKFFWEWIELMRWQFWIGCLCYLNCCRLWFECHHSKWNWKNDPLVCVCVCRRTMPREFCVHQHKMFLDESFCLFWKQSQPEFVNSFTDICFLKGSKNSFRKSSDCYWCVRIHFGFSIVWFSKKIRFNLFGILWHLIWIWQFIC